jgi:hypothetical protein
MENLTVDRTVIKSSNLDLVLVESLGFFEETRSEILEL